MMGKLTSQKFSFLQLCHTFSEIKNSVSSSKRLVFDKFLRKWREEMIVHNPEDGSFQFNTEDSFYPAMRLFVPSCDSRSFGCKESRLSTMVCKALMIRPLENCNSIPAELLVERLVAKIEDRFCTKSAELSIHNINESLDRLQDSQQKDSELVYLFKNCSSLEVRWIFYVILGKMEAMLGLLHPSTILRWFHREADSMVRAGDSLQSVCELLTASGDDDNGNDIISADLVGKNLLCKPFRPMLLKRLNYNKNCLPTIIRFCRRPFYMEVKYDGEHLLLHKYGRNCYKYFTRNGIDYTAKLGADANSRLSAKIHLFFRQSIEDCVLDCELLIWDKRAGYFVGKNRRASDGKVYDAKHLDEDFFDNSNFERSLAVFDVLYLNGRSLINLTLQERISILDERILSGEDKSSIFIGERREISKAQDFVDFYNDAMRRGEEGVVVKSLHSVYKIGSRAERNGWFKIKPDYGVQSVLDLAVVGVRFENNSNNVHSFLVAAREGKSKSELRFRVVAVIRSHLKKLDFIRLMELLRRDAPLMSSEEEGTPDWILGSGSSVSPNRNLKFVPYENIQVVEVRASGLLNGHLQFPSIAGIRTDKYVDDIDTVDDVKQFDERLRSRPMIDEEDPHEAVVVLNRKRRQNYVLPSNLKVVKRSEVSELIGEELKDRKVCVLHNNATEAKELQKVLISLGATTVANTTKTTDFVVASNQKQIRCKAVINMNVVHVVKPEWVWRCRDAKKLVEWRPDDLLFECPNATFNLFLERTDSDDGGSRPEKDGVVNDDAINNSTEPIDVELAVAEFEPIVRNNLFSGFTFFLHPSALKLRTLADATMRHVRNAQGKITSTLDADVTHVILDVIEVDEASVLNKWNESKQWNGQFVSMDWVKEAMEAEDRYLATDNLMRFVV